MRRFASWLAPVRQAVGVVAGRVPLEASGGVNLDTIRGIAETGVDFISVGDSVGVNPGKNRVRVALVSTVEECAESARRIADFILRH